MAWIESHQKLEHDPKVKALCQAMGWSKYECIGRLHCFWWWCVDHAPDGDLSRFNDAFLGDVIALNPSDSERFVKAMITGIGDDAFLERDPYFRIRNWWKFVSKFMFKRYEREPDKWRRIQFLYTNPPEDSAVWSLAGTAAVSAAVSAAGTAADKPTNQPTNQEREGTRAREPEGVFRECSEVPDLNQAIAAVQSDGIPGDFVTLAHADWMDNQGRNAAGLAMPWPNYCRSRWRREGVEWRAGTHKGKARTIRASIGPSLRDVIAYAKPKGDGAEAYAASWHRHWSDPKRGWKRNGALIDWCVEFSTAWARDRGRQQ